MTTPDDPRPAVTVTGDAARDVRGGKSDQIPLFVERQTYRRRRLVDAARAFPVLGLMLWLVPLLWSVPKDNTSASAGLIYVFAIWLGMPLIAAVLIFAMSRRPVLPGSGGTSSPKSTERTETKP